MSHVWGKNLKLSIFGESHGPAVGVTVGGLPPGFLIDWEKVGLEMARRRPGKSDLSTPRREADDWEILSGVCEGRTNGAPLCAVIRNKDISSGDYDLNLLRPGHADYTALVKYKGFADRRGGGHFSGRLTAPLVLAGAIAKQLLETRGIFIGGRIQRIGPILDSELSPEQMPEVSKKEFPVANDEKGARMKEEILSAKSEGDSLGGVIECMVLGVSAGLGDPFFHSLESALASMLFSIPAVKGVEFGDGFLFAEKKGSEMNDPMEIKDEKVRFLSNHSGGIAGGISNGQPIVFRAAIRPTPTIRKEQRTIDIEKGESALRSFGGRHDPSIVPRAVSAIEAGAALCILDFMLNDLWRGESL